MIDESLVDIVERWDEYSWIDRKRIWWKCFKHNHGITSKEVVVLVALLSILGVLMEENHPHHRTGLLAIIVLLFFYTMFIDYICNRAHR